MVTFKSVSINDEDGANKVLHAMQVFVEQEGSVSLQTLYDLIGYPTVFTDTKWGWPSMDGVRVVSEDDCFTLTLPEIQKLS